jgi:copper chaperone CopZ
MSEKTVRVPAITCGHCVANIRRELGELDGVISVEGDETARTVTVRWDAPATWDAIKGLLAEIGYPPEDA